MENINIKIRILVSIIGAFIIAQLITNLSRQKIDHLISKINQPVQPAIQPTGVMPNNQSPTTAFGFPTFTPVPTYRTVTNQPSSIPPVPTSAKYPTQIQSTPTTKPTSFQQPSPTQKPSPTPTKKPTATPTPAGACPAMNSSLPNSTMHYPNGSTSIPRTCPQIFDFGGTRNYSMPYRNPNCSLSQSVIQKAYNRMQSFYPSYFPQTKLLKDWQTVQTYAKKYNFNPIFVISLWIEESAAGGATAAQQLGCLYRLNKDDSFTFLSAKSTICEQMECLFGRRSVDPSNFGSFACQYELGSGAWNGTSCNKNPNFVKTLNFWYEYLSDGQPTTCRIKYCPGIAGC